MNFCCEASQELFYESDTVYFCNRVFRDMTAENHPSMERGRYTVTIFVAASVLFALLTVYFQEQALGLQYLETGNQIQRHQAVMDGTAPNAWQFRVLSEFVTESLIRAFKSVDIPHPIAAAFLSFRLFQNLLIFLIAAFYYRRLGLNDYLVLIGQGALAWGMTHALFDSDLQFSNYSEVLFYLAAALIILHGKDIWIIPVIVLAALNRETSGAIPFMLLAARIQLRPRIHIAKRTGLIFAASCAIYVIVFVGLRYFYGLDRPVSGPLGLSLFLNHVVDFRAWALMFATLSVFPFIAIASYRTWRPPVKALFWAVIPIWFIIIPFTGGFMETRHYLVPQSLIFIPGALLGAMSLSNKRRI
jgi:hypothetical protein